jgi:hypothetical protein
MSSRRSCTDKLAGIVYLVGLSLRGRGSGTKGLKVVCLPRCRAAGAGGEVKPPVEEAWGILGFVSELTPWFCLHWLKLNGFPVDRRDGLPLVGELITNAIVQIILISNTFVYLD